MGWSFIQTDALDFDYEFCFCYFSCYFVIIHMMGLLLYLETTDLRNRSAVRQLEISKRCWVLKSQHEYLQEVHSIGYIVYKNGVMRSGLAYYTSIKRLILLAILDSLNYNIL